MFNIFKSKAERDYDNVVANAHTVSVYASLLMTVAKNPAVVSNKKFLKEFKTAQTAWFAEFTQSSMLSIGKTLDLTDHNDQLVCSAMAVIIASVLEGDYSTEEAEEHNGMLNIIKKEANLHNVPRVYADAFVKYYESADAV